MQLAGPAVTASAKVSLVQPKMEKATKADISGHISATLSQIRGVYDNEADIRNFN